CMHTLEFPYSF
nr:immunoglobulin light chain junction region [Macaca mulatta]MOV78663.1 immunoglobulin light chain junction region [Macaca mulatta]MOV80557.1 immunoglobulin light chain junction region [Macaca mulatta]MOV86566.1 immunoglobulin light chain junction region [Macaca mulatta]